MGDWNLGDVFELIAAEIPDARCQVQGDRTLTWAEFDRRANGLAASLLDRGLGHQAKVAAYLYNCPEYLETYIAAFKAGLVPVNTNYRYGAEEIHYLFDNADVEAVVFHSSFAPVLDKIRDRLPRVRAWYAVDDGGPVPGWATRHDEAVAAGSSEPVTGPWGRSGDDLLLLYTGGTTGMPKGVMWRQDDLFMVLGGGGNPILGTPPVADRDELASRIRAQGPGPSLVPACPLMHGTGQLAAFLCLLGAGSIIHLPAGKFDPEVLWQTVQDHKALAIVIVGDAFARPMLAALDANPGRWDLSSLLLITSSGVMWSQETKDGLLKHLPNILLYDTLSSSEAVGVADSRSGGSEAAPTASFKVGERVKVLTDDGREVEPGSDEIGMLAVSGYIPVGYYKDPEKSAKTFPTFDGVRYSVPGDFAQVTAEGDVVLLGRGSVCINTGGEKVFPEEVEEVLKQYPAVHDAAVVGLPDERFGEVLCALVEPRDGASVDEAELIDLVRQKLARYKAPRVVLEVPTIGRSPSGKVDYRALKALAVERVQAT